MRTSAWCATRSTAIGGSDSDTRTCGGRPRSSPVRRSASIIRSKIPTSSRSCCEKGDGVRAFVTGGTGLIGRPLVDLLLADGWEVSVLTRNPSRAKDLEARGARIVPGDVTHPPLDPAMSRADVVFHVAGLYEIAFRDPGRIHEVNVTGTANVFAAARRENVGRIVFTGTAGVFAPTPRNRPATESSAVQTALDDPYVTSKVEAHEVAVAEMTAGLPLTIVLPAAVFGPGGTGDRLPGHRRGRVEGANGARVEPETVGGSTSRDNGLVRRNIPGPRRPSACQGPSTPLKRLFRLARCGASRPRPSRRAPSRRM